MHERIEKSAFRKGEYVGYAYGVWSIKRDGTQWVARHRNNPMGTPTIWGDTLDIIGNALDKVQPPRTNGE